MDRPSGLLRQLAARGRKIHAELLAVKQSKKSVDTNVSLGVEAIDYFLDLSGRKRLATKVGKTWGHSSADRRIFELKKSTDEWIIEVRNTLKRISVIRGGIPDAPNSSALVRSFSTKLKFVRPETRLYHGILYLEQLADSSLIFNDEIKETKKAIAIIEGATSKPPTEIEMGLIELENLFSRFPSESEAIAGALSVYRNKGPDWGRQALNSIRNALETLVKRLSGENDWSEGLLKIIPSISERKPIRDTYNLLSGRGTHANEIPKEQDVIFCIRLTKAAVKYIIERNNNISKDNS